MVRKWSDPVDNGANMLIPVPGGGDGPGGVLVCAENFVLYKHQGHEEVRGGGGAGGGGTGWQARDVGIGGRWVRDDGGGSTGWQDRGDLARGRGNGGRQGATQVKRRAQMLAGIDPEGQHNSKNSREAQLKHSRGPGDELEEQVCLGTAGLGRIVKLRPW